jgi:sulfate permease, SulP family
MLKPEFTPKFFTLLKEGITRKQLQTDIVSGIIVGIVALPLAIAFAIASGVSPEKGLVTAIIGGIIISVLGGSRVQIGGPTGAFIVIVYGIIQEFGVGGLTIATFMAGFIIIFMGIVKLGNYLKFIPYPLVVGFTSGIALIIFSSQVNDFFGLSIDNLPADFIQKWATYATSFTSINWYAAGIAGGTVFLAFSFHKVSRKIPGSIVAILLSTLAVYLFNLPVDTIESKFGEIPNSFSLPVIPSLDFETFQKLIPAATAIALLGGIESLLSAVVADGMIGGKHRSNMELIAQGVANIFSGIFGGIPATGAIARTATNIKNGGRTPVAGIVHAIVLLLIMLLFAPVAKLIPLSALAGILVVVAWHMGEWKNFFGLMRSDRMDVMILLTTFALTVILDLVVAIEVGMILTSLLFMKRMSESTSITGMNIFKTEGDAREMLFEEELPPIPEGVLLYEIDGPMFFGASQKFQDLLVDTNLIPKILILRMRHVPFIDATGLNRLRLVSKHLMERGTRIVLSGVNRNVKKSLLQAGMYGLIGKHNIQGNITLALQRANEILLQDSEKKVRN